MCIITRYLARRRWAHIRACHQYGHEQQAGSNWLVRHIHYDRLFRHHLRVAKIMQRHGHNFF